MTLTGSSSFHVALLECFFLMLLVYYMQVGIPIAAGVLLPITGTILTPSIAGALMGFSSIGVMMNSLLLRLKFSSKQKKVHGAFPDPKIYLDSVLLDQKEKIKTPWSDSRWR
jgi:Cu2+-exporting ATPase